MLDNDYKNVDNLVSILLKRKRQPSLQMQSDTKYAGILTYLFTVVIIVQMYT